MAPDSSDNDGVDLDLDCSYSQAKYQNSSAFGKKGSVEVEASGPANHQFSRFCSLGDGVDDLVLHAELAPLQ